ncbi:MAG: BamA/TamA family outer membrane protein [bacterium]|nr:MAG: BamA/TamA family outer membrane protein [bacterium]
MRRCRFTFIILLASLPVIILNGACDASEVHKSARFCDASEVHGSSRFYDASTVHGLSRSDQDDLPSRAAAEADMAEGKTIEGIAVIGNRKTQLELILWALRINEGEPFSRVRIEDGIKRLERLSGIERAELRIFGGQREDLVRIFLVVTEAETMHLRPLISRNIENEWGFGGQFSDSNLFGRNERLYISALFRSATILKAHWSKPFFLDTPRFGLGFSASFRDYSYPFPDFQALLVDGDIRRLQTELLLRLNIQDYFYISVSPGMDWIDVADTMLAGQGTGGIPESHFGTFSTVKVGVTLNMLDRDFYPSRGMKLTASRKDWGLFQDEAKIKNFQYRFTGRFAFRIEHLFLHLNGAGVFTRGRVPLILLQHLGGERTIRGYDYGIFSGANSIFGSAELCIPLNFWDISDLGNPMFLSDFHIFIDSGACWSEPDGLDTEKLNSGFGCGINFIPIRGAILKIDYAWHLKSSGIWQFDVGMRF